MSDRTTDMKQMPPDDVFEAPGFTMKRYGRLIEMQTHRTAEEQARFLKALWESRQETLTRIQQATEELSTLVRKYSSFDLVMNLWLRHGHFNPDQYKETESEQRPHFVEHAAMLQLRDPAHQVTEELFVAAEDLTRAEKLLAEIFELTRAYYVSEVANPELGGSPSALDELRYTTLLREMMVGPPAYTHHWMAVLDGLFGAAHIDGYLRETLAFNMKEALACVEGIANFMGETLMERTKAAANSREEMKEQLKRYIETGQFGGRPGDKAMFDAIRNMRSKERKRFMSSVATQWITVALSDVLSFSPAVLASRSGLPEETVSRYLDSFSLGFGSTRSDYVTPSPLPSVRVRPIVKMTENYVCPLPFNLAWAIKPRFEDALKQTGRWNSYQKHRSNFLVDEGLKALRRLLPASQAHQNLTYPIGPSEKAELDGLVLFDRYAFLLEAKAGEFGAARRGGKDGIKKGLEELVGNPSKQGARAWDYIRRNEKPVFSTHSGEQIAIDKSHHTEISPITLTLDSLDVFTPQLHRLRDTGVLGPDDLPWAVCLTDLMAISEILQLPVEFTHFLRWRLTINTGGDVSAGTDELNWLAIYLKEGPKLLRVPQGFTRLSFNSYTDDFDAYFLYQGGFRSELAERPAQPMPSSFRELLLAFEATSIHGFTAPSELLLDLSFEERVKFAQKLKGMERRNRNTSKPMTFRTAEVTIRVYPGQRSLEELRSEVARSEKTLVLAVDPFAGWRVTGWLIVPAKA